MEDKHEQTRQGRNKNNDSNLTNDSNKDSENQLEADSLYNMKINKAELIKLLKCPLCLGIFRTPTTINECMHSFCKSCIYKWFYAPGSPTRDSCPVCDIKLGGRPLDTLIFDNSLSLLVDILFPDFERIDKENTKKMFAVFRGNDENLPGDEEANNNKPQIKIYLHPLETEDTNLLLPEIDSVIMVPKIFDIKSMKDYLKQKIDVGESEISITYKNQEMPDNYKMDEIDRLYGFDQEKNVFSYARKEPIQLDESNNVN